MPPLPNTQAMPLAGSGGSVGDFAPSHQALQPPVGPEAGVASPETPQPGYSVTPLASGNENRYGECSVLTAFNCGSLRQSSPDWPAAHCRLAGLKVLAHPAASSTSPSGEPH